jgi:cytochrome c peroxidase
MHHSDCPTSFSVQATFIGITATLVLAALPLAAHTPLPGLVLAPDPAGTSGTYSATGRIDSDSAFFQSLGVNGRSCSTCHLTQQAMTFRPDHARQLYERTAGKDPLFASVDGANCPEVSAANRAGHSLILRNGLIRIGLPVPVNAQYSISVVHDPYGCALRIDPKTGVLTASVYRRPLPTANLSFLSAVMFDGRETVAPLSAVSSFADNLRTDLAHQAADAITTHAQASALPSDATLQEIVDFELALFTAQYADHEAGRLDYDGASGGPLSLAAQNYYPGINDSLGADPMGRAFTSVSMTLYAPWEIPQAGVEHEGHSERAARSDIAAGEKLFNTLPITITNVRGLNDNPVLGKPTAFVGHCTTCHDTPNVGDHSLPLPLDIGTGHTTDPSFEPDPSIAAAVGQLSMADLPVFLISGCPNPFNPGQPESFYTTDPGKALVSGQCGDFNRVKGPILRDLAARAPFFHNGSAASLLEAVNFYNQRFNMHLTSQQKRQLVAFLNAL